MREDKQLEALDAVTFISQELERKESVIEGGILPQNSIAIVGGISKQGKSIFVLNMGIQMATAKPFLQFNIPEPQKVIYLQAEISEQSMQNRLRKMLMSIDYDIDPKMLFIVNQKGLKITNPRDLRLIDELIKRHQANVLILDPLYKFNTGDENKVNDMTRFFDNLDRLITDNNISIVVVHHFGKPQEGRLGATQFRGSSAITDYADSYLMLRRKSGDESRNYMKLSFELRNEREPETMILYRNPETLWYEIIGIESNRTVTINDVVNILTELGGYVLKRDTLIEGLQEKFEISKRTLNNAILEAEERKAILSIQGKGKGKPKAYYLPEMQKKVEEMIEVGLFL